MSYDIARFQAKDTRRFRAFEHIGRTIWNRAEAKDLGSLIILHIAAACTDPRDHVFGLVGLSSANEKAMFQVDYGCNLIDLITYTISRCETYEGNSLVLGHMLISLIGSSAFPDVERPEDPLSLFKWAGSFVADLRRAVSRSRSQRVCIWLNELYSTRSTGVLRLGTSSGQKVPTGFSLVCEPIDGDFRIIRTEYPEVYDRLCRSADIATELEIPFLSTRSAISKNEFIKHGRYKTYVSLADMMHILAIEFICWMAQDVIFPEDADHEPSMPVAQIEDFREM